MGTGSGQQDDDWPQRCARRKPSAARKDGAGSIAHSGAASVILQDRMRAGGQQRAPAAIGQHAPTAGSGRGGARRRVVCACI